MAFLTGRALVENEQVALEEGAVDFIDKARGVEVAATRLGRILKALQRPAGMRVCGQMAMRPGTARAEWRGRDLGLTLMEYNVVALLASRPGDTYRAIYDRMHHVGFIAGNRDRGFMTNVRSALKRIRRKFLAVDPAFNQIINHSRIGYSWQE